MSRKHRLELRSDSARKHSNHVCIAAHWGIIASFLPVCGSDGAWRLTQLRRGTYSSAALLARPRAFVVEHVVRERILDESLLRNCKASFLSDVLDTALHVLRPCFRGEPPVDNAVMLKLVDMNSIVWWRIHQMAFLASLLLRFGRAGTRVRILCASSDACHSMMLSLVEWCDKPAYQQTVRASNGSLVWVTSSRVVRRSDVDLVFGDMMMPAYHAPIVFAWGERELQGKTEYINYHDYPNNIGCRKGARMR